MLQLSYIYWGVLHPIIVQVVSIEDIGERDRFFPLEKNVEIEGNANLPKFADWRLDHASLGRARRT